MLSQQDRYTTVRRVRDHLFRTDPCQSRTGYWVGLTGVFLTVVMVAIAPATLNKPIGKLPPILILVGLGIEQLERRREQEQ